MYRSDQKHMLDDRLEHPKSRLLVSAKSKRAALVDTNNGDAVFVTGDFSDNVAELERDVRRNMDKWPLKP